VTVLKPLYAIAIALLVVAFVGFGISAFYPEPEYPEYPPELEFSGPNPTAEERELMAEQREKEEAYQHRISDYNRVVSAIAIGVAVLLLVGSLLWISGLPVIGRDDAGRGIYSVLRFDPRLHDQRRTVQVRRGGHRTRGLARPGLLEILPLPGPAKGEERTS
jgi:hypothetical protein